MKDVTPLDWKHKDNFRLWARSGGGMAVLDAKLGLALFLPNRDMSGSWT